MNKQPEHFRYFLGATKIKLLAVTEIRERYVPSKKHMIMQLLKTKNTGPANDKLVFSEINVKQYKL